MRAGETIAPDRTRGATTTVVVYGQQNTGFNEERPSRIWSSGAFPAAVQRRKDTIALSVFDFCRNVFRLTLLFLLQ